MDKKKNINLPCLCAILLIILVGAVAYLYFRVFYLLPQEVVFSITTNEKLSYQLFDNQFSHMLTTITILIAMFGLAIPLATYFFQQRNFREDKEEINKIKDKIEREFDKFKELRNDFHKIQEDIPPIKKQIALLKATIAFNINLFGDMCEKNPTEFNFKSFIDEMLVILCFFKNDKLFDQIFKLVVLNTQKLKEQNKDLFNNIVATKANKSQVLLNKLNFISKLPDSDDKKSFIESYAPLFTNNDAKVNGK